MILFLKKQIEKRKNSYTGDNLTYVKVSLILKGCESYRYL